MPGAVLCLTSPTDPRWASIALADLDAALADHAHCEMKAAANAISLATRWPASTQLALALTAIAAEELDHFREVLALLERRGVELGRPETDAYVADLRRAAQESADKSPHGSLADRLLVGALDRGALVRALSPARRRPRRARGRARHVLRGALRL